jgi:hypothetical protein
VLSKKKYVIGGECEGETKSSTIKADFYFIDTSEEHQSEANDVARSRTCILSRSKRDDSSQEEAE